MTTFNLTTYELNQPSVVKYINLKFFFYYKNFLIYKSTADIYTYKTLIFFVILEIFLDAFFFLIIPVLTTFINCEFKFGKKAKASFFFFESNNKSIFFIAFLNLLLLDLLTSVCLEIFLIFLTADFVFAISAVV